jgi:hypothetical protein
MLGVEWQRSLADRRTQVASPHVQKVAAPLAPR